MCIYMYVCIYIHMYICTYTTDTELNHAVALTKATLTSATLTKAKPLSFTQLPTRHD